MSHTLVKIIGSDNSNIEEHHIEDVWHLSILTCGEPTTLCGGFYYTDNDPAFKDKDLFITKERKRGGITCPDCLNSLKKFKSIKL